MMEGQVEVTTLREEHYDPSDWTKIIGTYQGKSQSKFRIEDTKQKACEEHTGTLPASTWRPTYRPNPAHLRATRQVKRRRRLFLPNIQPQLLLRCLCERRIYPMEQKCNYACTRVHPTTRASIFDGYTCTVATSSQEAALNLVKIRSITLNAKSYGVAAYIVPAADTVSGVISNAFWDKTEEELLQDQQARNPEAGILLARRMGKDPSPLESYTMGECTCARHIARDQRPARAVAPQDTDMMCAQNRKDGYVPDAAKITAKTEHVSACPDASCAAESALRE
ncbi:hypothetical protein HPB49_025322 [Dermacentor silvarum]|uniref:Uncharacterized protein n=1 Tax=Dermacentor silvarum TaxID=543639 RepID=A0ACB8D1C8_DERSI|nr:hypothetical protein HPB49_025322 [Dermacentor silvarum]